MDPSLCAQGSLDTKTRRGLRHGYITHEHAAVLMVSVTQSSIYSSARHCHTYYSFMQCGGTSPSCSAQGSRSYEWSTHMHMCSIQVDIHSAIPCDTNKKVHIRQPHMRYPRPAAMISGVTHVHYVWIYRLHVAGSVNSKESLDTHSCCCCGSA